MLFSSLFELDLDFFLCGSCTIVIINKGCRIQGGMAIIEAKVLEAIKSYLCRAAAGLG
jgi:hypothetical protein